MTTSYITVVIRNYGQALSPQKMRDKVFECLKKEFMDGQIKAQEIEVSVGPHQVHFNPNGML